MTERPINATKTVNKTNVSVEIDEIKRWFRTEYLEKLAKSKRDAYLGLPCRVSRYALEMEAYKKENRLRELLGKEPLPEPKFKKII
jgi:hypothetical protein